MKQLVDISAINEAKNPSYNRTTISDPIEDSGDKPTLVKTWEQKVNKHDPEEEMGITEWRF